MLVADAAALARARRPSARRAPRASPRASGRARSRWSCRSPTRRFAGVATPLGVGFRCSPQPTAAALARAARAPDRVDELQPERRAALPRPPPKSSARSGRRSRSSAASRRPVSRPRPWSRSRATARSRCCARARSRLEPSCRAASLALVHRADPQAHVRRSTPRRAARAGARRCAGFSSCSALHPGRVAHARVDHPVAHPVRPAVARELGADRLVPGVDHLDAPGRSRPGRPPRAAAAGGRQRLARAAAPLGGEPGRGGAADCVGVARMRAIVADGTGDVLTLRAGNGQATPIHAEVRLLRGGGHRVRPGRPRCRATIGSASATSSATPATTCSRRKDAARIGARLTRARSPYSFAPSLVRADGARRPRSTSMVTVRLYRTGAKNNPSYRIVVMDSRKKRQGRVLEQLGTYDPRGSGGDPDLARPRSPSGSRTAPASPTASRRWCAARSARPPRPRAS